MSTAEFEFSIISSLNSKLEISIPYSFEHEFKVEDPPSGAGAGRSYLGALAVCVNVHVTLQRPYCWFNRFREPLASGYTGIDF